MKQFIIKGLDCANCAAKLERALQQIEGIREVSLDFMGQKIVYESDLPEEEVLRLMKDVAKKVEPDAVIEKIHHHHHHHHDHDCQHTRCNCDEHVEHEHSKVVAVKGLDCANCAAKLERALQNTEGFSHVSLDFMGQKIYYESSFSTHDAIKKMQAVADEVEEGVVIEALHQEEHSHDHDHGMDDVRMMLVRIIVALICFVASYIVKQPIWEGLLLIVSYLVIGYDIIWRSIKNILKGKMLDENFLMTFATFGAIYVQQYHEAVAVMLFYQVGELFQTVAVNRSRQSITELMDLRPDVANLKVGEEVKEVHPETLKIGDLVVVYPGEKIPVDGVIVEGTTSLDTSMLTGESMPQDKDVNDPVLSGCVNLSAMITVKVQKEFTESTASKILDMVENASSKKANAENFITKFAHYYTPIVVTIAILIAVLPPLLLAEATFADYVYRACIFLVVSCPCALVISVPLSFFGGIGGASKQGILLKGGNYLEALAHVSTIVFDKTGTLTEGQFEVQKICANNISEAELLEMTALLESFSHHPIARSIVTAYGKDIDQNKIIDMKEIAGYGLAGNYQGKELLAGNQKLMRQHHIELPEINEIGTLVYVGYDHQYVGYFVIRDRLKEGSKETIQALQKQQIHTVMLTGDQKGVAQMVADEMGIETVYSELLPQDKVSRLEEMMQQKQKKEVIAFVGDGMNDAPVLARADIGIAMGQSGSDAAIEVADVVIMKDDIRKLLVAQKIANKTLRIVKQNIVFALGVKILIMILGAFGEATMWEAVFADVGVAVIAILNATRALKSE